MRIVSEATGTILNAPIVELWGWTIGKDLDMTEQQQQERKKRKRKCQNSLEVIIVENLPTMGKEKVHQSKKCRKPHTG